MAKKQPKLISIKTVDILPGFMLTYVFSGRGAVWLARMTGGHEVAGSSPVAPIFVTPVVIRACMTVMFCCHCFRGLEPAAMNVPL